MELKDRIKTTLCQTIREQMKLHRINAAMLSEFAELGETSVASMLRNEYVPNALTLCKIAKVFRVSLDDLLPREAYQ